MEELLFKTISIIAILIIIKVLVLSVCNYFNINYPLKSFIQKYQMYILFLITTIGTIGSFLMSTYLALPVCNLCWYQRMFLFPHPLLIFIALFRKDNKAHLYVFYFALVGMLFSLYHSFLQSGLLVKDQVFCNPDSVLIDCSIPYFTYFGFVTAPIIAFSIFALIAYVAYPTNTK